MNERPLYVHCQLTTLQRKRSFLYGCVLAVDKISIPLKLYNLHKSGFFLQKVW